MLAELFGPLQSPYLLIRVIIILPPPPFTAPNYRPYFQSLVIDYNSLILEGGYNYPIVGGSFIESLPRN